MLFDLTIPLYAVLTIIILINFCQNTLIISSKLQLWLK